MAARAFWSRRITQDPAGNERASAAVSSSSAASSSSASARAARSASISERRVAPFSTCCRLSEFAIGSTPGTASNASVARWTSTPCIASRRTRSVAATGSCWPSIGTT